MDRPDDLKPIIEKYKSGMSTYEIGSKYGEFGVTPQTIRNWLRRSGVKLRGRGGQNNAGTCHTILSEIPDEEFFSMCEKHTALGYSRILGVHGPCLYLNRRNRETKIKSRDNGAQAN